RRDRQRGPHQGRAVPVPKDRPRPVRPDLIDTRPRQPPVAPYPGGTPMSTMPAPSADQAAAVPAAAAPRGRASWSGLLRLSLVAVPVKAYPATTTSPETHCHQLHAACGQRIRYLKQCPVHGPVEAGAIVRGYPYAPDQYVVIADDQLDRLRPAAERALC